MWFPTHHFYRYTMTIMVTDYHSGAVPSATRTWVAVSAEITAGSRRSRRLKGLPPATAR